MDKNKITSENFDKSNVEMDRQTKKKSNAQKALPWLIVAIVSLIIILTCVLIAYYQIYNSSKQNSNTLEGIYASSYYSMVDNVNNLAVDVAKYGNLTTNESKMSTMQDMVQDCNYIVSGLSVLPIDEANVTSVTKFFNQVSGLCEAYIKTLSTGGNLSQEQELIFDKIALVVGKIKSNLNTQNEGMYDSNFNFVDAGVFDNVGMNELSSGLGDLTTDNIDYPAMIFDGPFSTALETKEVKGLPENEIDERSAYDYLVNTVYANRDVKIEFNKETNGDISTFDYNVTIDGKHFMAQVSKRGGLLITLSGYAESGDAILSNEYACEMASTFANNIGFENMETVWLEIHDNVAYVNLAPIVNNIIYYPDLVKVKVDLTAQEIIGFEAVNYALNHVDRNPEFNFLENEAESLLGFDYEIIKTSKAVIRLDSGIEISAWEFFVERIDGMYFYYINANTNEIAKTMKLVSSNGVQKLI